MENTQKPAAKFQHGHPVKTNVNGMMRTGKVEWSELLNGSWFYLVRFGKYETVWFVEERLQFPNAESLTERILGVK